MRHQRRPKSKHTQVWRSGWWARTPLGHFHALLSFANELDEANWEKALWESMGEERFCSITYSAPDGPITKIIYASNVMFEVSEGIGLGSVFLKEDEQKQAQKIEEAIKEIKNELPKIFSEPPSLQLTKTLRSKVRQVLDCIVAKVGLISRQRDGEERKVWTEQARKRDVVFKLTERPSDYSTLPWECTYFEQSEGQVLQSHISPRVAGLTKRMTNLLFLASGPSLSTRPVERRPVWQRLKPKRLR